MLRFEHKCFIWEEISECQGESRGKEMLKAKNK